MTSQTLSHVYDTYDEAVQAVYQIERLGVPAGDVSLVGATSDPRVADAITRDPAENAAGLGATIGATAGGGVGLLAGIGALTIPGIGPLVAAGWFLAALTGAGVGAAAGGLLGALVGQGLSREQAHAAAEGIQRGGTLVVVRSSEARADEVARVLRSDNRQAAAEMATASPVLESSAAEQSTMATSGDYSDELAQIRREQDRIQNG